MISSTQTNQPFAGNPGAEEFLSRAIDTLRGGGCRITGPRVKLLRILGESEGPLTVEELHHLIGRGTCDLVTIYRCMAAFEEFGLVSRTFLHSGTALYERSRPGDRAYRIVCKVTDRVERIDPAVAEPIRALVEQAEQILRDRGYGSVSHVLEFFVVSPEAGRRAARASLPQT